MSTADAYCRYVKVSTDFHEHIGKGFKGIGAHMEKFSRKEIAFFTRHHFQNFMIFFSDVANFS